MSKKRFILSGLVVAAIAGLITKAKAHREAEWHGLTESEARAKLDEKLPGKIPADKRSAIADKVVAKMRERGALAEDPVVPDDASSITDLADRTTT